MMTSADADGGAGDAASPPRSVIEAAEAVEAAQPHVLAHAQYGVPEMPQAFMALPAEVDVMPPQEGSTEVGPVPPQEGLAAETSAVGVMPPQEGSPKFDVVSPKVEPIEAPTVGGVEQARGSKSPPRSTVASSEPKRSRSEDPGGDADGVQPARPTTIFPGGAVPAGIHLLVLEQSG